jgi:3-hydroxybutyryl-CoA dehydrogenase
MAPGIAAAVAAAGPSVRVLARRDRAAAQAAEHASKLSNITVAGGPIDERSLRDVDMVIETVLEDLDTKCELLKRVEPWLLSTAVIATNTSSLPLEKLAGVLLRPNRFVGLYFLNPAEATALVEITRAPATDESVVTAVAELVKVMGKRR